MPRLPLSRLMSGLTLVTGATLVLLPLRTGTWISLPFRMLLSLRTSPVPIAAVTRPLPDRAPPLLLLLLVLVVVVVLEVLDVWVLGLGAGWW